jgi:hypothetical protein
MRTYNADNTLLFEMLGKGGGTEVFTTVAQANKDWYCIFFPVDSVITTILTSSNKLIVYYLKLLIVLLNKP